MAPDICKLLWPGCPAVARVFWCCLLLAAAGCRAPAARVATTKPGDNVLPCTVVFARQIVEDSLVEMAYHPGRSCQAMVAEPANDLWSTAHGTFGKCVLLPLAAAPGPVAAQRTPVDDAALETELDALLDRRLRPARVRLYSDGEEALAALKQTIAGAVRRIDVLMFQWENDAMGADLAASLAAKAGPGLRVRVLVDGGGNLIFGHPSRSHPADVNGVVALLAQKPYVEVVRIRNPFGRVDHRKLVVADGRVAWTGGRNFTHQSFFDQRDVSLTVEGPLAAEMAAEFDRCWLDQGGRPRAPAAWPAGDWQPPVAPPLDPAEANARARLVGTGPMEHQIEKVLYHAIDRAQHHVYLENYTFGDGLLVYKLARARQRGVDVRVLLTFSDCTKALNRANRVVANRLLAAGVRVYVYPGMTHTKAAAVDGCWAYLGTGNFDPLSLRRNHELGLALSACPLVEAMERHLFQADFRTEWELRAPLPLKWEDYLSELVAGFCL